MNRATKISGVSQSSREKLAEQLFEVTKIANWIADRSILGFDSLRIYQSRALNLEQTPAAIELQKWLTHEGFDTKWSEAAKAADPLRQDTYVVFSELVISW